VKYHVSQILQRLDVESRHEAVLWQGEPRPRRLWAFWAWPVVWAENVKWSTAAKAASGAVLALTAVGIGLLVWGALHTTMRNGETSDLVDLERIVAPREIPVLPPGETNVLSYDTTDGSIDELPVPALEPSVLSPDGSTVAIGAGTELLLSGLDGDQHTIDRAAAGAQPTDWSADGERMLVVGSEGLRVLTVDTREVATVLAGNVQDAVWSPDEKQVAFIRDQRLGVLNLDSGQLKMIANELTAIYLPNMYANGHLAWAPDGRTIAFAHWTAEEPVTQGRSDVYLVNSDGTDLRALTDAPRAKRYFAFSPDGEYLSYIASTAPGDRLRIVEIATGRQVATDVPVVMSFSTPWIANDALLTSSFSGISLAKTDGSVQPLISSALTASTQCTRSLIGWASGSVVFRNACSGRGN
jgi:hypothetical protein